MNLGTRICAQNLDGFAEKGLRKDRLQVALCMLCEVAVVFARAQNGCVKSLTSQA